MAGYYAELNVFLGESPKSSSGKTGKKSKGKKKSKMKSIATKTSGVLMASAIYANSKVGEYTGNKLRQSNNATSLALIGMGIASFANPLAGTLAVTSFAVKSAIDNSIRIKNSQQESAYRMSYKGNMTTSGSRWKGAK